LDRFWFHHSHWAEGRRWLERALAIGPATPSPERAKALAGAGHLSWALSDYATARTRLEESMSVSREVADDRGLAYAALCLAWPIFVQGDYAAAGALATESLVRFRALDDRWGIVAATCSLGNTMMDASRSRPLFEGSLASAREMGDVWGIARASLCLGELARAEGDYDGAAALYEEALRLSRLLSQRPRVPHLLYYKALFNLGQVAALRGDAHTGVEHLAEALALLEDLGDRRGQGLCLAGLATMASLLGQPERAARFFGAADALLSAAGVAMEPVDAAVCEPHRRATRSRLGAQAFADARDEGATLAPAAIIAEGLAFATEVRATCPSDAPPDAKTSLSSREMDVLRLLVEGHSNPEIATALFISHRTVRNHVTNILAKLDVESRTAAATLALREGLV
jgi:DNA-binding CsgD family transcriptional regulator/tetratricopeptide (TPR) repeat protein